MNIALPELIDAIRRTLADAVAPELSSDHARGQLAAVQDILGKLARMTVWAPESFEAQAQALRAGIDAFLDAAAQAGVSLSLPEEPAGAGPEGALHALEAQVLRLCDWLGEAQATLPPALHAQLDSILRQALREQLLVQRKRIPLTDFGAMTAATKPT